MTTYEKSMTDAFCDDFNVGASAGQVTMEGYADHQGEAVAVADLSFAPRQALKLARVLIKAAMVAYDQERHASL